MRVLPLASVTSGRYMSVKAPKGEIAWVGYYNREGDALFILTSKPSRETYFLYEVQPDGALKKLGRAKEPPELEEKYRVYERLRTSNALAKQTSV